MNKPLMNSNLVLSVCLLVLSSACYAQSTSNPDKPKEGTNSQEFRYTNPITRDSSISMRDHCIIKVGNLWYCTGTSNPIWTGLNPGVRLLVSEDMIHWRQHSWLIDAGK
jgi:beta-xylosidase